jgi:hypothetical protein
MTLARIFGLTAALALFAAVIVGLLPASAAGYSCGAALAADDDQSATDADGFSGSHSADACEARLHKQRVAFGLLAGAGLIAGAGGLVQETLHRDRIRYRNRVYDLSDDAPRRSA